MKIILALFVITFHTLAQNFIDLGNLEIEGELRRPAINLFTNTEVVKDNLFQFARDKIETESKSLDFQNISNDIKQLNNFEASLLEI